MSLYPDLVGIIMPAPASLFSLPAELLDKICDAIKGPSSIVPGHCIPDWKDTLNLGYKQDLLNFCVTCRYIAPIAQRSLHTDVDTPRLMLLLRTLVARSDLALCVRRFAYGAPIPPLSLDDWKDDAHIREAISEARRHSGTPVTWRGQLLPFSIRWPEQPVSSVEELEDDWWKLEAILCSLLFRHALNMRELVLRTEVAELFTWSGVVLEDLRKINFVNGAGESTRNLVARIAPNLWQALLRENVHPDSRQVGDCNISQLFLQTRFWGRASLEPLLASMTRLELLSLTITHVENSPSINPEEVFLAISNGCPNIKFLLISFEDDELELEEDNHLHLITNAFRHMTNLQTFEWSGELEIAYLPIDLDTFLPPSVKIIQISHGRRTNRDWTRFEETSAWYQDLAEAVPFHYPELEEFITASEGWFSVWEDILTERHAEAFRAVGIPCTERWSEWV